MNEKTHNTHPMMILFIILFVTPLVGSPVDIYVPSLPFIAKYFHSSIELARLSVPFYLLAYGAFQLVQGSLADSYGRRNVLVVTLIGFTVSTFMLTQSDSIYHLLIWRAVQGLFMAGVGVSLRSTLSDTFSGTTLMKYASYVTVFWAIGPILSPYLGGYLQHLFNWKASFYFLGGYSFICLLLVFLWLPETNQHFHRFHIKTIAKNYHTIVSSLPFVAGALICGLSYGVITLFNVVGPFYIEIKLGHSPVVYGELALFLGIGWFCGNLTTRFLVVTQHIRQAINLIMGLFATTSIIMLVVSATTPLHFWGASIAPVIIFVFAGSLFTYYFGKSLSIFPKIAGAASAALGSLFSILAGIMALVGSWINTETLLPLYICYVAIIIISIVLHLSIRKKVIAKQE